MKKINGSQPKDETERIMTNPYLAKKLIQSRKDGEQGKGIKISIEELAKYFKI
ncbi:hypothetical protein [Mucilaginibacter sp.]|uniref:hypothetical protein n=1 Tax=Mucilaginibacter sp. TaxID=1882438 RepID=UPI0026285269|nr:hypothetical protein [Mucilaginibacter sp.]MDB4923671.1 hypothetical protein [Mucilaginibacter sp.]